MPKRIIYLSLIFTSLVCFYAPRVYSGEVKVKERDFEIEGGEVFTFMLEDDITLTLEETVRIAYENNKNVQIQEKELQVARALILGARSNFLPKLDFYFGYTHNDAVPDFPTGGKKDAGVYMGYENDNMIGINVTDDLYMGGANIAKYRQAKLNLEVQHETLRAKKLDVEFETKRLFYGLLLAHKTLKITQDLVDQAQWHYENVESKFEYGTSSRFDALQSRVHVSLLIPQLVEAENSVRIIGADLKKLLSMSQYTQVTLDGELACTPIEINEGEFLKEAYLGKPEMIIKSLGVDISSWAIKVARAEGMPKVNLDFGFGYRSNNWNNMFNYQHNMWSGGVRVSMPIFDGFLTRAKVQEAKAKYKQADLSKVDLIEQIAVDVKEVCLDLNQALAIIKSQEDNIFEAEEALKISEVAYASGVGINLDVLDAQVSLAQVRNNLVQGIYSYLMADAQLDRVRGIESFPFIEQVTEMEARNEK